MWASLTETKAMLLPFLSKANIQNQQWLLDEISKK